MEVPLETDELFRERFMLFCTDSLVLTAQGDDLDRLGVLYGLKRKGSTKDFTEEVSELLFNQK